MLSVAAIGALAGNTAEVTSTNLRAGAAFDNIKASWNQALKLGDFNTNLRCDYDYNANKDFLSEACLSGDLVEGGDDDVTVSYEVTHDFSAKNTNVKLSAVSSGTTLSAEYDQNDGVTEVSAERDVELSDQKVNVQPSWLVKSKTARVKLMSALGDSSDEVSAQIDYDTDASTTTYELGYSRNLESGRDVELTFSPDKKELEIDYTDDNFEDGATWTASASVPLDSGSNNVLDAAKLTLKRAWTW